MGDGGWSNIVGVGLESPFLLGIVCKSYARCLQGLGVGEPFFGVCKN